MEKLSIDLEIFQELLYFIKCFFNERTLYLKF